MQRDTLLKKSSFLLLCLCLSHAAWSFPYSDLYIFGDSMSDPQRLFATADIYPPPYVNGPLWPEYLTKTLLLKSYNPENNFAWAGAMTNTTNWAGDYPGLQDQIEQYLKATPTGADPEALYVVWIGTVDLLAQDISQAETTITQVITRIKGVLEKLQAHGVRHLLVPNIIDLGRLPRQIALGNPAAWTALTLTFNQALADLLTALDVIQVDLFSFFDEIITTQHYFANTTAACLPLNAPQTCSTPQDYLFWDDVHLSTLAHQLIAALFHSAVAPPYHLESMIYPLGESRVYIPAVTIIGDEEDALVLGVTLQRSVDKKVEYAFLAMNNTLYLKQPYTHFVPKPVQVAQPALYDLLTGHLHLPLVHRIESETQDRGSKHFVAKFTADLSLLPETDKTPFRAPLFLLMGATVLTNP
jgi:phospholipase/lecithinase/hemolysin